MKDNYFWKSLGVWGIGIAIGLFLLLIIATICALFCGLVYLNVILFADISNIDEVWWSVFGLISILEIIVSVFVISGFIDTMNDYKQIEKKIKTKISVSEYLFTDKRELIKKYKKEEK